MGRARRHIRANVVGYVAVFMALTGSAAALPGRATVQSNDLKPNAVRSKHIKDGQIRGADVANGGLAGADIANSGLTGTDLAADSLTGAQIADEGLTGLDIAANSLTGANIDEDTLGGGGLVKSCTFGSVHAAIRVNGSDQFSSSFTAAGTEGFTCPGGGFPLARRAAAGVYEVCFGSGAVSGSQLNLAIGNALHTGAGSIGEDNFVTVGPRLDLPTCDNSDGAAFEVRVQDIGDSGATLQDGPFALTVVD